VGNLKGLGDEVDGKFVDIHIDRSRPKEGSQQVFFNLSDAPALEKKYF
jgi:hypothetical protein